jgi:hypothetical protein
MNPSFNSVGSGFFTTLGIPLLSGREFTDGDIEGAPKVAVVNEAFARYFYKNESPIGRRFGLGRSFKKGMPPEEAYPITIVGVSRDSKASSLRQKQVRFVYVPYTQQTDIGQMTFYVRSPLEAGGLGNRMRTLVRQADAGLPVTDMKTMRAQIHESLFVERIVAVLSAAFGLLATLLAAIGLYGVMSYAVSLRTREIGIRVALGAERRTVLFMVLKEVAVLALLGIVLGLPSGYGLGRLVESQLYGLTAPRPAHIRGGHGRARRLRGPGRLRARRPRDARGSAGRAALRVGPGGPGETEPRRQRAELLILGPRRAQWLTPGRHRGLQGGRGVAQRLGGLGGQVLLAEAGDGNAMLLRGKRQRVPEVLAVRGVDERVRGQDRFQPRQRAARGGEDDRAQDVVAVPTELGEGGAQPGVRALSRPSREAVEQRLGPCERELFRRVIRLLLFRTVRHLDAAAVEDPRAARGAAHRHQRGPAGMSAQPQRSLRTTRRHAFPSFTAGCPIMPS